MFYFANAEKVDAETLRFTSAGLTWQDRQQIDICLTEPVVSISATPIPVQAGSTLTVTAHLSRELTSDVTVPVGAWNRTGARNFRSFSEITIPAFSLEGTARISMPHDVGDNETFDVAIRRDDVPPHLTVGSPDFVHIHVLDDDEDSTDRRPTIELVVLPDRVPEGSSVTATVTLSKTLASAVTIPLKFVHDTSEEGDHGILTSLTIPAGDLNMTSKITTVVDADGDNETFTVSLGALPSSVTEGSWTSTTVTIYEGNTPPSFPARALAVIVDQAPAVAVDQALAVAVVVLAAEAAAMTIQTTTMRQTVRPQLAKRSMT